MHAQAHTRNSMNIHTGGPKPLPPQAFEVSNVKVVLLDYTLSFSVPVGEGLRVWLDGVVESLSGGSTVARLKTLFSGSIVNALVNAEVDQ